MPGSEQFISDLPTIRQPHFGCCGVADLTLIPSRVTGDPPAALRQVVMTVQVFDLTHVYEAIIPAQGRVI
jgi:hypothetical protein